MRFKRSANRVFTTGPLHALNVHVVEGGVETVHHMHGKPLEQAFAMVEAERERLHPEHECPCEACGSEVKTVRSLNVFAGEETCAACVAESRCMFELVEAKS